MWFYSYAIRTPPKVQMNGENMLWESVVKNTEMNKTSHFFVFNMLFCLFLLQNNNQYKILVHQMRNQKWSLFRQNNVTWKSMFCLHFPNWTLFFSFSFNNNVLALTAQNLTKSYRNYLQNTQHVVLRNRPTLSIGTERLTCLNNPHGVQLGTLA